MTGRRCDVSVDNGICSRVRWPRVSHFIHQLCDYSSVFKQIMTALETEDNPDESPG